MTIIDMFCGCGGMGLGFKKANYEIKGAYDFDKFAIQTYKANVDENATLIDIKDLKAQDIPIADVWSFGFPCQDISIAGGREGLIKGARSSMFFEVMRLLDEATNKPKIILAENVKALKRYLPILKDEYEKQGYRMYYTLYNSKYWGVPQNRERYFVIGVRNDINKDFVFPEEQKGNVPMFKEFLENKEDEK